MITEATMREVEELLESSRIGGRPTLSLELRQALAEMAAYYKAGVARAAFRPEVEAPWSIDEALRHLAEKLEPPPHFVRRTYWPYPCLEVSDDGRTWRELDLEAESTARNPLQLAEQVGELNGAAPAAAEPEWSRP